MSFIPARKMPHVTAAPGEFDAEEGKIIHLNREGLQSIRDRLPDMPRLSDVPNIGWIAGGAGLAAAALGAALFALRSSTPTRRRPRATVKRATTTRRRRTTSAKRKAA